MKKTLVTTLSLAVLASCGGGSGGGNGSTTLSFASSEYFPSGLAISSPTASTGSKTLSSLIRKSLQPKNVSIDPEADFETKAEALAELAAAEGGSCTFTLPTLSSIGNPPCYGPQLWYVNHLDWVSIGDLGDPGDGTAANLPGGDLGLWEASFGGEACAAAKLNSSMASIANKSDAALTIAAAVSCIANSEGFELSVSESQDIATALDSAMTDVDYSVNSATLTRLADSSSGNKVYKISVSIDKDSSSYLTFDLTHSPDSTDESIYEGVFSVLQEDTPKDHAFSLAYQQTGSDLNYQLRYADYNASVFADIFNSNGSLKLIYGDMYGNLSLSTFNMNLSTQETKFNYAWLAGPSDDSSRVFQIKTEKGSTTSTGVAFFGFGSKFNSSEGDVTNVPITKFICNWAGPEASHTGIPSKAQKQLLETNSTGNFIAIESFITYAPVNDCDMTLGEANSGAAGTNKEFWYWTGTQNNPPGGASAWDAGDHAQPAVTNDLVDLDSDSDYSESDLPTAPTISF